MKRPGERVTTHVKTYGWDGAGVYRIRTLIHVIDCQCITCWDKSQKKEAKR